MELGIIEKWQHSPQVELFYNASQRKLVFKKYNYIYSKGVDDFRSYPYIDLNDFSALFKTACFSQQETILAFQRNEEDLVRFIKEILLIEGHQHIVIHGKNRVILGYHWIHSSTYSDLVVIDTNSVEFFKVSPPTLKLSSVKSFSFTIGHYWYSAAEAIIVVALSPPKLGQFITFFLHQTKGSKNFMGPRFALDLSPCVTDKWTVASSNVSSLTSINDSKESNSPHTISLLSLYSSTYFLHMQSLTGQLKVFRLTYEKFEIYNNYNLKPGEFGIRRVDNLIVMMNYTLQESYLVDIKADRENNSAFCVVWNDMKEELPMISIKIKAVIEKPKVVARTVFMYDGKSINNLAEFTGVSSLVGEGTESSMKLDSELMFVDDDICVDTKAGRCYKLQINPLPLVDLHPNRIESMFFLFRRKDCRTHAFAFFKSCLHKYIHIKELARFFLKVNEDYKGSVVTKKEQNMTPRGSFAKNEFNRRSLSLAQEPELKIDPGSVVISQHDMYTHVFLYLFEENRVECNYLAVVLQEYIRSLAMADIDVYIYVQLLLSKMLLKCGEYKKLADLLMFKFIDDSYEMINLLISHIPNHYGYLQVAVDMMFRVKHFEKMIDLVLDHKFIFETLALLEKVTYPKFDILRLLAKCEEIGDKKLTLVVTQFIKEKSLA